VLVAVYRSKLKTIGSELVLPILSVHPDACSFRFRTGAHVFAIALVSRDAGFDLVG